MTSPSWLPEATCNRVAVTCTARYHGGPPRRLPDRRDLHGAIATVLVDNPDRVEDVLRRLDQPGRTIYVDVERKQHVDLYATASTILKHATLAHTMPNSVTIRSLDVLLTHTLGPDLSAVRCGVYGTGNLGFKSALLLAERNAAVFVSGRSATAVVRTANAINAILPKYHEHPVAPWMPEDNVNCMITAVTAQGVVGSEWLSRLDSGALVIDVGIDNLHPGFIAGALASGGSVTRLDTRIAESQLLQPSPGFFEGVYGRSMINQTPVVAGGVVGERGAIVVDNLSAPSMVVGVANGVGGLVAEAELTSADQEGMHNVARAIPGR